MTYPRITLLTTSYPLCPGSVSGIFVARLLAALPSGLVRTVVTPATADCRPVAGAIHAFRYAPHPWERLAHAPGGIPVALRRAPWLALWVPGLLVAMAVATARAALRSDIIHANWAVCGLVGGLVGRLLGRPVVTTLRGEDVSGMGRSRVGGMLLATAVRLSTAVVTVSDAFREDVGQRFPQAVHKLSTIPNGVDDAFLAVGRAQAPASGGSPLVVVSVGNLIPRKGLTQLFTALTRTRDVHLDLFGEGPERGRLETLAAALGLSDRVTFRGRIAPEDVPAALARADVFVLASHSEGRPNVVLEAMAAGLPVVATAIEGVRELIADGETGLLFPDGDVDRLAAHLGALRDAPVLRDRLGRAAHASIVARELTWEAAANRYLALYRQVLARPEAG
ncbi:Glycosyl transferase family 1 domain-containing protein [Gammaproteobacteria bacterium]